MSRLRDEIEREVGQDPPNLQSLKRMTYLSYVLKEGTDIFDQVIRSHLMSLLICII